MDGGKMTVNQLDNDQRLHLSILHGSRGVCKVVEESLNPKISFERDATALIGEIVWKKLQEMGSDLEHFAKHAKRTTIKSPDVLLLTRRNPSLTEHLNKLVKVEEKRRRKPDGAAAIAGPSRVMDNVEIESNVESNDGFSKPGNRVKDFNVEDIGVYEQLITLSDDD